jgi:hypothetical protein
MTTLLQAAPTRFGQMINVMSSGDLGQITTYAFKIVEEAPDDEDDKFVLELKRYLEAVIPVGDGLVKAQARNFGEAVDLIEIGMHAATDISGDVGVTEEIRVLAQGIVNDCTLTLHILRSQNKALNGDLSEAWKIISLSEADFKRIYGTTALTSNIISTARKVALNAMMLSIIGYSIGVSLLVGAICPAIGKSYQGLQLINRTMNNIEEYCRNNPDDFVETVRGMLSVARTLADANRQALEADMSVESGQYEKATRELEATRQAMQDAILQFPENFPFIAFIREVLFNRAQMIPQAERYVRILMTLSGENASLTSALDDSKKKNEMSEEKFKEAIIGIAQQKFNVTIDDHSSTSVENQVLNNLTVTQQNLNKVQDRAMDEIVELLQKMVDGGASASEAERVREKADGAKRETDVVKKIEKVAAVIEGFGKVAEAVADIVPYGRTVYQLMHKLLMPAG